MYFRSRGARGMGTELGGRGVEDADSGRTNDATVVGGKVGYNHKGDDSRTSAVGGELAQAQDRDLIEQLQVKGTSDGLAHYPPQQLSPTVSPRPDSNVGSPLGQVAGRSDGTGGNHPVMLAWRTDSGGRAASGGEYVLQAQEPELLEKNGEFHKNEGQKQLAKRREDETKETMTTAETREQILALQRQVVTLSHNQALVTGVFSEGTSSSPRDEPPPIYVHGTSRIYHTAEYHPQQSQEDDGPVSYCKGATVVGSIGALSLVNGEEVGPVVVGVESGTLDERYTYYSAEASMSQAMDLSRRCSTEAFSSA
ncbi:hypothetical protein FA15DRAFT_717298 [Coprinopsis marcescibilis]|uniref:Uncharacterized protein n=1 Tax=Coprinopsis marcescibilis TaxID=230819 RepID=A0A5C3KZE0_COPMA|nr:hypothetical protein FA15DRAFT_717298 [Coprinopsis marcescibilis]